MPKSAYIYEQKYKPEYARLHPRRVLLTTHRGMRCVWIRKGNGEHFKEFWRARLWRDHREELAERTFRRLAMKAQKERFYQADLAKKRGASATLKEARRFQHQQNLLIAQARREKRAVYLKKQAKDQAIGLKRKAARRRRDDFLAKWKRIYGHLFVNLKKHRKKGEARRATLKKATQEKGVCAHIERINRGPVKCHWCRMYLPDGGQADHVVPLSKGGKHSIANVVPSCTECNSNKSAHMPDSFEAGVAQLNLAMS